MPPKKLKWGDILNISEVIDKDVKGKWIHCKMCNVIIKVRSQFSFTEWNMHTDGVQHNQLANSKALKNIPKLTTFFKKEKTTQICFPKKMIRLRNDQKSSPVQDFTMVITLTFYLSMLSKKKIMK